MWNPCDVDTTYLNQIERRPDFFIELIAIYLQATQFFGIKLIRILAVLISLYCNFVNAFANGTVAVWIKPLQVVDGVTAVYV